MTPRRIVVTLVLVVGIVTMVAVPINWGAVDWGTVPTWIGAIALVFIAVAAWIAILSRDSERDRSRSL